MDRHRLYPWVQRLLWGSSLVVLVVSLGRQALPEAVSRAHATSASVCTPRNVAGAYGFSGSGTALTNDLGLPEGQLATVGIVIFERSGQWRTTNQLLTVQGEEPLRVSLTGTYSVDGDCTFTLRDDVTGNMDAGVFVLNQHEGFFMGVGKGIFLTFTMKRIATRD
jgi:hypothetical protein